MPAELLVLLPGDRAELLVLPDDVHHRRAQAHRGLELLAVHEKSPVAADRHDVALRVDQLRPDRGGEGESHPRQAICDQHCSRLVRGIHPADPQLVQAHV